MTDLWSVLLQTLTASGAAALLLAVKALFRDKLSPRWQFGIWGLLALVLLLPAGAEGRYVLFPWPLWVEAAKTALTGDYALTRVLAPVPLPRGLGAPENLWEVLYLLYLAGVVLLLGWYILTYLRLRLALRRGRPAGEEQVRRVAAAYGLTPCRAVAVPGLPTAFVCGVVRPVLALPEGVEVDDKVILHELLHLRHHDAAWGLLICLFRCLHWCNPLLWYCADRAGNDAEALCDQRVLERLEGEDRRDYGRILLSAASERYARAPGTSSLSNGGRNIRARIQAIARFKRYPAGMALVSVCIAVVLGLPLALGRAQTLAPAAGLAHDDQAGFCLAMASARLTLCTTPAGALDAYGKAVLEGNGIYRALCAPLADHPALAAEMEAAASGPDPWVHEHWESGLPGYPDAAAGYFLYNLEETEEGWDALVVWPLQWAYLSGPEAPPVYKTEEEGFLYAACQRVRAERQGGRWVVLPQGDFWVEATQTPSSSATGLSWGDASLPAAVYRGEAGDFALELTHQTIWAIDNRVETGTSWLFGPSTAFDTVPRPNAQFEGVNDMDLAAFFFTGPAEDRGAVEHVSVSLAAVDQEGEEMELPLGSRWSDSISYGAGTFRSSKTVPADWDGTLRLGGGGSGSMDPEEMSLPTAYAAKLSVNGGSPISLTLYPVEGGEAG